MALVLMCKNNKVFNIDTEEVYNANLLPGLMKKCPCKASYRLWMGRRRSESSNSFAVNLKNRVEGEYLFSAQDIDLRTYALSLSDSYWVKDEFNPILFEEISPYFVNFYQGVGEYKNEAIPGLYLPGCLSKEWFSKDYLYKYGNISIEVECYEICKACKIPCSKIVSIQNGVAVKNFTNSIYMLEQADMSGKINVDDFSEKNILDLCGLAGLQMIVIDAIIANGDRHAGNFGWLRDTNTGEYISMAPLYDFDHALDSELESDFLLSDLVDSIKDNPIYLKEALRICRRVKRLDCRYLFKVRAKNIEKMIKGLFI